MPSPAKKVYGGTFRWKPETPGGHTARCPARKNAIYELFCRTAEDTGVLVPGGDQRKSRVIIFAARSDAYDRANCPRDLRLAPQRSHPIRIPSKRLSKQSLLPTRCLHTTCVATMLTRRATPRTRFPQIGTRQCSTAAIVSPARTRSTSRKALERVVADAKVSVTAVAQKNGGRDNSSPHRDGAAFAAASAGSKLERSKSRAPPPRCGPGVPICPPPMSTGGDRWEISPHRRPFPRTASPARFSIWEDHRSHGKGRAHRRAKIFYGRCRVRLPLREKHSLPTKVKFCRKPSLAWS